VTPVRRVIAAGAACTALVACSGATERAHSPSVLADDKITVGSFDFAESVLLAEIYSQALETGGFTVDRAFALGPREFVGPALHAGLIEFVPEYAGTAVTFFSAGARTPSADAGATHRHLVDAVAGSSITVLEAAPAQNSNVFVVTRETARRLQLTRLSDLTSAASELVLGGPSECPVRRFCELGLRERYGLTFAEFVALDAGGPLTHQALRNGDVDVALLFATDPRLAEYVVLIDDRLLQPAENVTPLVHRDVIQRFGADVVEVLDSVSSQLDTDGLRRLNAADATTPGVDDVAAIAAEWLGNRGLR
jgi:osmoprotectant transport system substrate-binding protein